MLQARFLGQYEIRLDGQSVVIPSRPAQSLFAFLLLNPNRPNRRERLAGLFWPDSSDTNARSNLRQALWRIRKALGPAAGMRLQSDDLSVSYLPQPGDWLDVDSLEGIPGEEVSTDELIQVVSAYGGELLPGFYEDWATLERQRLQASYERKMGMLLDRLLAEQRWNETLEWGERWIAAGGVPEPAYRALMLAHAGLGDLAGAAAQYQRCVEVLSNELGVEPSERTRKAFEQLRELGLLELPATPDASFTGEPAARVANPYKGLLAFQEADADNFFGREALTGRLVARLGEQGEAARFLAVVGPSGSGKSSLVKAGLIPALRQGALPSSEQWLITELFPGSHPFEELEISLLRICAQPISGLREQLHRDDRGLLRAARLVLPGDESVLLLVIDQFEEVFTLVEDKAEARLFLESLCVAVTAPRSSLRVLITLRADFFDRLLLTPDLSGLVQDRTEMVIPLTVDEMERAIREPAERAGVTMESGLVAAIVADMVEQPGALPLLQYALSEIFEQRTDHRLTIEAYQAIGGVPGVLEHRAEKTFAGLSPAGQAAARQAFLRLVTLGEGLSAGGLPAPDTHRRVLRSELEAVAVKSLPPSPDSGSQESESAAAIAEALDVFGKARLLFFDRDALTNSPTVEIAHEALLSEWRRLQGWLDESREDVRMQRLLGRAAAEWSSAGRDASFLLRGTRLSLFETWFEQANLALTGEESLFLEAGLAERNAHQIAEADRKKHSAALERRARIFLRALVVVLLLATLGSLVLAWTTKQAQTFAEAQSKLSASRELAAQASSNLVVDPERSILLSLQALRTADTNEAVDALHRAIQSSRVRATLNGYTDGAWSVDFSPDGKAIVTASMGGEVTVLETGSWRKLFSLPGIVAHYSPDGRRLATGGLDGTITIWDLDTRQRLLMRKGHNQLISDVRFSPDGRLLVSTGQDATLVVWDSETGEKLFSSTAAYYSSFSPDGRLLITSGESGTDSVLKIWGADRDWALLNQLPGYAVSAFSPDGKWLVACAGSLGNQIALWDLSKVNLESVDLSTVEPQVVSQAHNNSIINFAFSPDGSLLATASTDGTAKVWRLSDKGIEPLMILSGHSGEIWYIAFSPDGTRLATAGEDGTVRIWDVTPSGASEWFAFAGQPDSRYRLALTRDGRFLATAGFTDSVAKVWDLDKGKELLAISNHGGPLFSAGISPDGSLLATAGYDNIAKIWKLDLAAGKATAEPLLSLNGHASGPPVGGLFPGLTATVFSPDGTRLATGGVDGMARIWDVKTGQELLSVQVHPDHRGVTSLAFSPGGRRLATASDGPEPLAKIWNTANGTQISTFSGHSQSNRIWGLAFSPDGERVATGSQGGGLKIWDAKTGQELLNLVGHTSTVVGVAFSPDGKYLASASADGTARVWDAFSGEELQIYTSPTGALLNITFTPDGKRLIASGAGYIYGYIFDQEELASLAVSRLTRGFTPEECRQYLHQEECPPQ